MMTAKGRGREEENERYVCDVLGMRKIDKNHMKPPKKASLITSQQHPFVEASEANKNAEFHSPAAKQDSENRR